MKYSQNNEQDYILNYFNGTKGIFLDIGAYDGIELSNTRALADNGWHGVCVEPNPDIFKRLEENYNNNDKVKCYDLAIGQKTGTINFWQNDTYYSTTNINELQRWSNTDFKFKPIDVMCCTFNDFIHTCGIKTFDFISIDAEGVDFEILLQMDLKELQCKMICVEHNGKETEKYIRYIKQFGLRLIHINHENIIMAL